MTPETNHRSPDYRKHRNKGQIFLLFWCKHHPKLDLLNKREVFTNLILSYVGDIEHLKHTVSAFLHH